MKIYFLGSIKGKKHFKENYNKIVTVLKELGHTVYENTLNPEEAYVYGLSDKEKNNYYKKIVKWISTIDVMVAEISFQSISLGHEITLALGKEKPVISLYTKGNDPHLLQGLDSEKMIISEYNLDSIKRTLTSLLEDAKEEMDVRFNFFVSPKIVNYLDWIAKQKRMPRAVYLRKLIEIDMEKNKEFLEEN